MTQAFQLIPVSDEAKKAYNPSIVLTLLQMQPMTDMAPWFMGGLSVLGLITFLLLLFLCILLAILLFGIRARLNAIIGGMNNLSHDLKRLSEQLRHSKTKEDDSERAAS